MKSSQLGLITGSVLCLALPAWAHHAFNMYDNSKYINVKGTVKEFKWTNPHANLFFVVRAANGKTEDWVIECSSPNIIGRKGWKATSLKPGDTVELTMHPMKDGSKIALMVSVTTTDGQTLKDKS
jgi:hypothetical protein